MKRTKQSTFAKRERQEKETTNRMLVVWALELAIERLEINDCEGEEKPFIKQIERALALFKRNALLAKQNDVMVEALKATLIPLIRLGDFIGNVDSGGASGLGPFDRGAIIGQVKDALAWRKGRGNAD